LVRGQALFRSGRTPHHAEAADIGCDRRPVGDWKVGSRARACRSNRAAARRGHCPLGCRSQALFFFGVGETTALPEAAYQADTTERVYDTLSNIAQHVLAQGCSVVLDAAFPREAERAVPASLAHKLGVHFVGLFLTADLATRLARIEQRRGDASDATRDVVLMQEAFSIGAVNWHMVDASGIPDQSLHRARLLLLEPTPGKG
jgi:predicted kinase